MDAPRGGSVTQKLKDGSQFAGLLFATIWGVYTFVYKETILPERRPATLTVTTSLEELGRTADSVLVRLRIHAINPTDRRVYVALWYNVEAFKLVTHAGGLDEYRAQIAQAPQFDIQSRYSAVTESDVVAVGTIYKTGKTWFEPTHEDTTEVLFAIPLDRRFDALYARSFCFLTKDVEGLELTGWEVNERGELSPKLTIFGRPYNPDLADHYAWAVAAGAGFTDSISTVSLWEKSAPPASPGVSTDPRVANRAAAGLEN